MYLKPHLGKAELRDFTTGNACKLLSDIYQEKGLSRKSLRHCRALLSTIFGYAKQTDVIAGDNPIQGAKIPRAAKSAGRNHAYSVQEMMLMLNRLEGTARTAVALMYFCGLRPGEARGQRTWTTRWRRSPTCVTPTLRRRPRTT
jgi:integrase